MNMTRWRGRVLAGVGLALALTTGCQTYFAGATLPSPRYLEHPPTYIPPSPPFPFTRELAYQEQVAIAASPEAVGAPAEPPAPVPAAPGPGGP